MERGGGGGVQLQGINFRCLKRDLTEEGVTLEKGGGERERLSGQSVQLYLQGINLHMFRNMHDITEESVLNKASISIWGDGQLSYLRRLSYVSDRNR